MCQKLKLIWVTLSVMIGGLGCVSIVGCSDFGGSSGVDRSPAEQAVADRLERDKKWEAKREARRVARETRRAKREAEWAKREAEAEEARKRIEEEMAANPPKKRVRKVRRFRWESPAEIRGKVWNVPEEADEQALLTAFTRICIAEADGNPQDCAGIWQVLKNLRSRSCNRGMIRRITECDENGETMISVMRRAQRHVMGMIPFRNKRARWIAELGTDCEQPESWPYGENRWDAQYGSKTCPNTVALARSIIQDKLPPSVPGFRVSWLPHRPITWGGDCRSGRASCDDQIACSRGLNRIPGTDTHNSFWCYPSRAGCPDGIDPVCKQYRDAHVKASKSAVTVREEEPTQEPAG